MSAITTCIPVRYYAKLLRSCRRERERERESNSVLKSLKYTTLSIVETGTSNRRGHTYWISIFWTGKIEFRLTSNFSAAERAISKKFNVEKFTIEFYTPVEFAPDLIRRSAARGPKKKTFPPTFLENGEADRCHSCTLRYSSAQGIKFWNMPHLPRRGWGGVPPNFDQKFCKIGSTDFR